MSTKLQLEVSGLGTPSVVITPAAFEARRVALEASRAVTEVKDAMSQAAAVEAAAAVRNLAKLVEASREEAKAPVLKLGKAIDSLAKDFVVDLKTEDKRLSLIIGAFAEHERAKAAAAEAAARKEEEMVKERLAQQERARIGQETAGRTGTLLQDLDAKREAAAVEIVGIRQTAAAAAVATPDGVGVRKNWKFEVEDVDALYKARPDLCVIEPNNAAIRAIMKPNNGKPIPGLRIWSETAAIITAKVQTSVSTKVEDYDY